MATHSSILTWRIPWTEEPGGLPSMESQRVGLSTHKHLFSQVDLFRDTISKYAVTIILETTIFIIILIFSIYSHITPIKLLKQNQTFEK